MDYQTFQPDGRLADFVKCYWSLEDESAPTQRQTIVPDGCIEMIFHYGDRYRQYLPDGGSLVQPRCFVIGQLTQPLEIEPTGKTGMFSVRFHPGGFLPFVALPPKAMENKALALEELFGEAGHELGTRMLAQQDTAARIALAEDFLIARLADAETVGRIVRSAVETLLEARGRYSVQQLSEALQVHRRHLERQFASTVGLSPKQLSRIVRLQAVMRSLLRGQYTSLTALAYEGEYYDQAHFIRDFKEFTGQTPREFYGDHLGLSSLFYGSD